MINIFKITFLKTFNLKKLFFIKINIIKTKIENMNKENHLLILRMKFKKNIEKFIDLIFYEKLLKIKLLIQKKIKKSYVISLVDTNSIREFLINEISFSKIMKTIIKMNIFLKSR